MDDSAAGLAADVGTRFMLYRLLFGAAAASLFYVALDRVRQDAPVAGVYPLSDEDADFDLITSALQHESARYGLDGKCTTTRGLAVVVASRRAHRMIAAGLGLSRGVSMPSMMTT